MATINCHGVQGVGVVNCYCTNVPQIGYDEARDQEAVNVAAMLDSTNLSQFHCLTLGFFCFV